MATQIEYGTVTTVESVRDILVTVGLGTPLRRAATVLGISLALAYLGRMPDGAWDDEGEMRPFKLISQDPEATYNHFLVVPVALTAAVYLFS
jgi:hypothetical protein